jgi:uncharacterized membrane protein
MAHSHGAGGHRSPRPVRVGLALALLPFALATIVGLIALRPTHRFRARNNLGRPAQLVDATLTSVTEKPCVDGGRCFTVVARLTSGPEKGLPAYLPQLSEGSGIPVLHTGDKVVLGRAVAGGQVDYYFADYQRSHSLLLLAGLFALAVVGVARWRGLAALAGLVVAWLVLVEFVMPAVLDGRSPVAVALVGSATIMFVVLYVAHGVSARTSVALLGTLVSLALTGALAAAFVAGARLTGLSSDEATYLQTVAGTVTLSGIILAGIVIGSLGVLNDVTVTQASSVWEIHEANPARGVGALYRSGMHIGRDHIASTVYTLVLAYAGASLPLLITFSLSGQRVGNVLTGDLVAEEIVRTLVGSIGLVASVPITTLLAAVIVGRGGEPAVREPRLPRSARWQPPRREREVWGDELPSPPGTAP